MTWRSPERRICATLTRLTESRTSNLVAERVLAILRSNPAVKPNLSLSIRCLSLAALLFCSPLLIAAEHGGGGGGGPTPLQFTVNVGKTIEEMRFLMTTIVLEYATPEAQIHFNEYKPKLQHHIILMLSDESPNELLTAKGKQELQERIASGLNKLLGEDTKTGIAEVLFTDFVIQ